jgi:hypothetical protein
MALIIVRIDQINAVRVVHSRALSIRFAKEARGDKSCELVRVQEFFQIVQDCAVVSAKFIGFLSLNEAKREMRGKRQTNKQENRGNKKRKKGMMC